MTALSADSGVSSSACTVSDDPSSHFQGVLDRFSQIQPKLIFSVEAVVYNGKEHGHLEKLQRVVKGTWGPAPGACVHTSADLCVPGVPSLLMCVYVHTEMGRSPGILDACACVRREGLPQKSCGSHTPAPPPDCAGPHAQTTAEA